MVKLRYVSSFEVCLGREQPNAAHLNQVMAKINRHQKSAEMMSLEELWESDVVFDIPEDERTDMVADIIPPNSKRTKRANSQPAGSQPGDASLLSDG
jgi:hypothetical protein